EDQSMGGQFIQLRNLQGEISVDEYRVDVLSQEVRLHAVFLIVQRRESKMQLMCSDLVDDVGGRALGQLNIQIIIYVQINLEKLRRHHSERFSDADFQLPAPFLSYIPHFIFHVPIYGQHQFYMVIKLRAGVRQLEHAVIPLQ